MTGVPRGDDRFAIAEGDQPRTGQVFRIEPDGTAETAADDLWCPNGIVITMTSRP